ncbi:Gustatory receptor 152c [Halyomorpha halys]|nr:Gustatory receptor 152c [Halyomorpha halys]
MELKGYTEIDNELSQDFDRYRLMALSLGLFPLRIHDGRLLVSFFGSLCSIVMISILLFCILAHLLCPESEYYTNDSSNKEITFIIDYGTLNLTIIVHLVTIVLRRDKLSFVLRVISKVKRHLELNGIRWEPHRRLRWSVIQSLTFVLIMIIDPFTYDLSINGFANTLGYYFQVEALIWVFTAFMWFTDALAEGFNGLTSCVPKATTAGDVELLLKIHYLLTRASRKLNKAYTIGLTLTFVASFILILSSSYEMIANVVTTMYTPSVLSLLFWAVVLLILFFRIIDSCSNVNEEAKKFDAALYRLLVYKSPARVTQNMTTLKLFFHFSGKPEVVFTLSGFLKLDWNLLYSMMAAGCAYLIVIIQLNHFI